jgi:hypothetical protein
LKNPTKAEHWDGQHQPRQGKVFKNRAIAYFDCYIETIIEAIF